MALDPDTKLAACKLILAAGATYIGVGLGTAVLGAVAAPTIANLGSDLVSDLTQSRLRTWREHWYTTCSDLNHDIHKGLASTFPPRPQGGARCVVGHPEPFPAHRPTEPRCLEAQS